MGRKLLTLCLLLLPVGQATGQLLPARAAHPHDCRCTERLCTCLHHQPKPAKPKCHSPSDKSLPSLQDCSAQDELAVAPATFLLPDAPRLTEPAVASQFSVLSPDFHPVFFPEVSPPPPRFSFA